jgi:arylsulfatase A-like enzyme
MRSAFGRSRGKWTSFAALLTLGLLLSAVGEEKQRKPNLLFVLADQWRFSAFSHSTDPGIKTPHIDRLAAQGMRFTNAYATVPLCSPNRAVILTGRYGHQTGLTGNNLMLPPWERTLAHAFADAGYRTHYIGKLHLDGEGRGFVPPGWRRRGFQGFEGFNNGHRYARWREFDEQGNAIAMKGFQPTYQTDRAIAFMEEHRDEPFFLFLSWGPPHHPYIAPEPFKARHMRPVPLRPNVPAELAEDQGLHSDLKGYYGLCRALDREMSRLLKALERLELSEDTILVFSADHGDMLGSHGRFYKNLAFEESLHVPLIFRQPGRIPAETTPALPVGSIDLMPTVLKLCGIEPPESCEGRDLSPFVLGNAQGVDGEVYCQGRMYRKDAWRALVTERHKLVVGEGGAVTHLFDLVDDPYEMNDLAAEPEAATLRAQLSERLFARARELDDPFPAPVEGAATMYEDEGR